MRKSFSVTNIYKLAWPAIISHATVMLISIIDLAFIANLGGAAVAIAAAAVANNICAGIYAALEGIRSGTAVLIARFHGAGEPSGCCHAGDLRMAGHRSKRRHKCWGIKRYRLFHLEHSGYENDLGNGQQRCEQRLSRIVDHDQYAGYSAGECKLDRSRRRTDWRRL